MTDCIRNSQVLLYADDTVIYRSDSDVIRNHRNIQGDLIGCIGGVLIMD